MYCNEIEQHKMMHTTYCSSIISLTSCTTFNDYSYYYSNQRCQSTCCCSFLVPTNPSFLYGLRQSTLINCPPSRRFILGSNDRYCCRSSVYHVGRCCCFESSSVKQVGLRVDKINRKSSSVKDKRIDLNRVKDRPARPRHDLRVYAVGDAEAMLSLLSNEIVEGCVVFREKKKTSSGKVVCKQNVVIEELGDGKKDTGSGYRESKSKKHRLRSDRIQSRDEDRRRKGERDAIDEDSKFRRRESGSSYYSISDTGEFGSDIEVELGQEQFVGESSTSLKKDSRKSGGVVISEEAKQGWEKYRDDKDLELRISGCDDHRVGSSIQENWRKKSEKKLTEESQDSKFKHESVLRQSQLFKAKESNSMVASSSKKEFNHQEQQLTSDVNSHKHSSSLIQNDNRISEYSKYSSQHEGSTQKRRENIETTSVARRRTRQGEDLEIVGKLIRETGCEYCKTCGRSMEDSKAQSDFQWQTEKSKMSVDNKSTTNAESLSEIKHRKQEKGSSSLQRSTVEEKEQHAQLHMVTEVASAKKKIQHHHGILSSDDSCVQSTLREHQSEERKHSSVEKSKTSAESQSETRRTQEEKRISSLETSVEENRHYDQIYQGSSKVDARRESLHHGGIMDADDRFRQSNLRSQQQSETRLKHLEETTSSLIIDDKVERLHEESNKVSHTQIGHSRVHSSDMDINSQSISDKSVYNEQTYSKAKLQSLEELVVKRKRLEETIVQSTVQTEVQGPSTGQFSGEAIISQPMVPSIFQSGGRDKKSEQLSVTSPKYQYQSLFSEASNSGVRNTMGSIIEVGSGSTQRHPHARSSSFYGEDDDSGIKSGVEYTPEDELASAACVQESSALNIGVFVEQISHEASTSETSSEKKIRKLDVKHSDDKRLLKRSSQLDTGKTGLPKQGLEQLTGVSSPHSEKKMSKKQDSSSDFSIKGSSDQMWDVNDHFVQEASEMESSEGTKSESVVAVRTGKSLWNIVANICRLRWGSLSENQKSPVIKLSSPTGSAGGETWFSGDEVDEAYGDGMKAEKISLLQETTSDQSLLRTTRCQKADVIMSLDDKLAHVDAGASSSTALQSSSPSEGALAGEITNLIVPQNISLPKPSVGLSVPSARHLRRSPAVEEIDEEKKKETLIGSSEDHRDSLHDDWRSDVSPSEVGTDISASEGGRDVSPSGGRNDTDSGRKKLQRSKLVLQRFDEWEDAYRREREKRKVDEIFMREALSEAIKAGDSWEVPVGAVLVQNGKIIARGYNLVEELRDSTAHAEMICIREASNALRSWRLSETTLYVTLEPCPMCAGAILQARINTLVWGAPNKLLGADGSWIRLFPEGMQGEERSEVMDKPAAPVHPFHPKMNIRRGILQEECADIMQQFFQLKRRKAKSIPTSVEEGDQPTCFPKPKHKSKLLHKMHNVFHPSDPSG